MKDGKKRALFIYDQHGWAWDFMTRGIIKNLPEDWIGEKMSFAELSNGVAWWSYDGVWFWSPNLLYLMIKKPEFSVSGNIPTFPQGLHRRRLVVAQRAPIIVGYYGSANTKERIRWSTSCEIKGQAFICQKYMDLAMKIAPQGKDAFHIIHPAVDHEVFSPRPITHTGFQVGWAGHANWDYKRTYLLDQLNFTIKMKADWGAKYFVKDRPFNHMADFYNRCDCYVCVSKQEGIPQPILESASCELPILSTDVGGISDFLDPEHLCPVNPEEEVVKFMNENLAKLETDPELRRKIGLHYRKKVEDYWNWKERAKQIVSIWEKMKE